MLTFYTVSYHSKFVLNSNYFTPLLTLKPDAQKITINAANIVIGIV